MDDRFGRRYEDRRYEDDERRFGEWAPRESEPRRYRGEAYYGGRGGYDRQDRGFFDRAGDELRSWFGDEEAERRRREDERRTRWQGGPSPGWGERDRGERSGRDYGEGRDRDPSWDFDERAWARQWGYVDGPYDRTGTSAGRPRQERWTERPRAGMSGRDDWWITRGPYSGRGPKGYQRSDERIREDVCDLLCEHGALDASNVEVQVIGREVTLLGFVPSRGQKRLAEDLADTVPGVNEVHNQIRVNEPAPTTPPSTHGGMPPGTQPGPQDWRNRAA